MRHSISKHVQLWNQLWPNFLHVFFALLCTVGRLPLWFLGNDKLGWVKFSWVQFDWNQCSFKRNPSFSLFGSMMNSNRPCIHSISHPPSIDDLSSDFDFVSYWWTHIKWEKREAKKKIAECNNIETHDYLLLFNKYTYQNARKLCSACFSLSRRSHSVYLFRFTLDKLRNVDWVL